MNNETRQRIKEIALYIERFRELDEEEQVWLRELLKGGKVALSCLKLLDAIENQSLNYEEIGIALGCSTESAKQRLNALISGGIAIKPERDGRFVAPKIGGRPRRLSRLNKAKTGQIDTR